MLIRLLPLVLGAFAIGTETFMITGVLPIISSDLQVSPAAAGSLVTIFALAYAFGSPLLAVALASVERKRLLMGAMGAFAAANFLAALAPSFAWLAAARVLLALTAGTFMPAATAFATATYGPSRRGHAVALVYAGMTLATVIGVPAGSFVASQASWRATFVGVGLLALVAAAGVAFFLPRLTGLASVGLKERLAIARRPAVLKMLALTALVLLGPFAANTYLGVLLESALGVTGNGLAGMLMLFGLLSFGGSQFGGYGADRWNRERFVAAILVVVTLAFALLSIGPLLGGFVGAGAVILGLCLWGLFGWAFPVTQQARLVSLDPALAPITLSLNTSALYLGAAAGSALGGFAIRQWSIGAVGWIAAASEVLALAYLAVTETQSFRGKAKDVPSACVDAAAALPVIESEAKPSRAAA
jgi:predicted MFS family arabinose efflux permease